MLILHSTISRSLAATRYRLFPCLALSHQESLEMQKLCRTEWERASAFFEEQDPILEYSGVFQGYVHRHRCHRVT